VSTLDCTRCGACCTNPDENRAEGYREYVTVVPREALLKHPKLVERYVVYNGAGEAHLKLDAGQRCCALRGGLGKRVRCEIYALRPAPCKRVEAGSTACLRARAERGITE
jgi:Fe-S-cluster containining protein